MSFVRNAWYVAAWSDEIKPYELFHRTLLGEPVVLYRRENGEPVALYDRCPHRFVPLHMGKLRGDVLECAYHGLRFDCSGRCVLNPHGDGRIPAAARVRSFPVVERHGAVWIWMGEQPADAASIPDYGMLDAGGGYRISRGSIVVEASYVLFGENLLDLSHIEYLHDGILGSAGQNRGQVEVTQEGSTLVCNRWMPDIPAPGAFDMLFRQDGKNVDMWTNMRWFPPGCFLLDAGVQPPGGSREQGAWYYGIHLLTPQTESSTHYFFAAARPPGRDLEPEINEKLAQLRRVAFEQQDKPVVEAQQRNMGEGEFWSLKPVLLSIDAAPVRFRRTLEAMVKAEQAAEQAATQAEAGAAP
jgi:vanillate O-demethylase monooxygenase subunit